MGLTSTKGSLEVALLGALTISFTGWPRDLTASLMKLDESFLLRLPAMVYIVNVRKLVNWVSPSRDRRDRRTVLRAIRALKDTKCKNDSGFNEPVLFGARRASTTVLKDTRPKNRKLG